MRPLGIDSGSLTTKVVLLDDNGVPSFVIVPTGDDSQVSAAAAIAAAADHSVSPDELYIVATGMGGKKLSVSRQQKAVTTCLARGVSHLFPSVHMVVDMGAESTSVLKLNKLGRLCDWASHDKCAAGTGLYLQQMAKLMKLSLPEMAELSFQAKSRPDISSTCAVFAESEVISHVHRDPPTPMPDLAAGIFASVVARIMSLCKRVGIERDVAVTGGVALNSGLVSILERELGVKVMVPENPQTVAALGAAIIAGESLAAGGKQTT